MTDTLDTVLLLALPASGKSEVRKYMASLDAGRCASDFRMGPTVQLDDFPYVHMMRVIDGALTAAGAPRLFFVGDDRSFIDRRDWGTLIQLINGDHRDLIERRPIQTPSAGEWLLERIDIARTGVGAPSFINDLDWDVKSKVCDAIVVNMIDVGEETGDMDTMLMKIADNYDEEVDVAIGGLIKLIEPLLVVVLGGIIGTIVIAMFLPMIKMIESLQK